MTFYADIVLFFRQSRITATQFLMKVSNMLYRKANWTIKIWRWQFVLRNSCFIPAATWWDRFDVFPFVLFKWKQFNEFFAGYNSVGRVQLDATLFRLVRFATRKRLNLSYYSNVVFTTLNPHFYCLHYYYLISMELY